MENNQTLKIVPMKFPEDKTEISNWKKIYKGTKGFNAIKHYILEDNIYYGLDEVIETNHEMLPIGDDEKKLAFVAKLNNTIVAWILLDAFDLSTENPEMFLQYIVINPKYQNQGIGTEIAKELFLNAEKYIGIKPKEIFAYIDIKNIPSQKLFKNFNFSFRPLKEKYLQAYTNEPKYIADKNPATFGE